MAKLSLNSGDSFMPEFWPANKLIGILEHVLVEAKDIIGQLTSEQIKDLAAEKITGQLTDAQLKEIAAAKIAGQLTSEQIKELAAAKISGQLIDAQIKELTAGKIKGVLTSAQIESLEATKITGQLTSEQIKELEAAKIAGQISKSQIAAEAITTEKLAVLSVTAAKIAVEQITAEKIAAGAVTVNKLAASSVTAEKLAAESVEASKIAALAITTEKLAASAVTAGKIAANSVTTEKILAENITAAKIAAGAITATKIAAEAVTTEKLAAGSITATKLAVSELSAIVANLGTVTSGIIENTRLKMKEEEGLLGVINRIAWFSSEQEHERVQAYRVGKERFIEVSAGFNVASGLLIRGNSEVGKIGQVLVFSEPKQRVILNSEGKSNFLLLPIQESEEPLDRRIWAGNTELEWPGGSPLTKVAKVKHKLGKTPIVVVPNPSQVNMASAVNYTESEFELRMRTGDGTSPAAGTKQTVGWIAFG